MDGPRRLNRLTVLPANLAVVAIHAELDTMPSFADGRDVDGRVVQLVGADTLRTLPDGEDYVAEVLGRTRPRRTDPRRAFDPRGAQGHDALCYAIGEMQPARRQERMRSSQSKRAVGVLKPIT